MISALVKSLWISLCRDRIAMALTFALPCVMFSVFAVIFGSSNDPSQRPGLKVLVADLDQTKASKRLIDNLQSMERIDLELMSDPVGPIDRAAADPSPDQALRMSAAAQVKGGKAAAAIVVPKDLEQTLAMFGAPDRPSIEVIYDPANPLANEMLTGVLQAAAFTSAPDVLIEQGLEQFRIFGGEFTPLQQSAVSRLKELVAPDGTQEAPSAESAAGVGRNLSLSDGLVRITSTPVSDVFNSGESSPQRSPGQNMISYYAAGISVMFIMFSMSGAASSLLEHEEKGTLERLLTSGLTVFRLLLAHWLFFVLLGVAQMTLMFVLASIFFGLDFWNPSTLLGSLVMAVFSSMASASFVLMLATRCHSRKQLEGLSSIIILIMSALGGSMMPRFIMPRFVLDLSSVTFNSWAMDGFLDVFWHRLPSQSVLLMIAPEILVLLGMTAAFLTLAWLFSRRWAVQ